ncbi:glycosyltransferase family 4 protein [Paenibacillus protaetiae]|uniref:glycosyltransferase family 4 protein n=1 Tax=Paenibacillus protaetiae TaxID=2509456 RepID=UPI001FC91367|nr:glycosyltransferase family 4 protein [Paenibacillus protaetiae]
MRIVHVAPCHETVPPSKDGGTERIVHELTEGLVQAGHEVILYAPPGSSSSGTLITYPSRDMPEDQIARFVRSTMPKGTALVHDHTFSSAVGRMKPFPVPVICTLHLPTNNQVEHPVYVSSRALQLFGGSKGSFVYNGIRLEQYQFSEQKESYLLFIGRIIREKGIQHALDIADQTGEKLIIAGPIHDPGLFDQLIKPRIQRNRNISYVGPVGGQHKQDLLKHAKCVLFPSIWEEPFGLVMVEAMACGTPVLALNNGATSEVLAGFPEYLCQTPEEMIQKLPRISSIATPAMLRQYVADRFTTLQMTYRYLHLYEQVAARHNAESKKASSARAGFSSKSGKPNQLRNKTKKMARKRNKTLKR